MRESVIYHEIFQEGELRGRQEGRQEEAVALILRILIHRFGEVPASVQAWIRQLTVEQLEALADRALTVPTLVDLVDSSFSLLRKLDA